ncbi:hypothetical protein ACFW7J_37005, partial [Streptomyces sp. NPDC059525]|uniref:hypothetical protein n=1 Tax=Streptomyces sp. NPDC059525 TaxID=3346857 RepID=UPI00367A71BE
MSEVSSEAGSGSKPRRGHRALRRIGRVLPTTVLSAASFAGIAFAGVSASMADSFAAAPRGSGAGPWPAARPVPPGRITVAVAVG